MSTPCSPVDALIAAALFLGGLDRCHRPAFYDGLLWDGLDKPLERVIPKHLTLALIWLALVIA